jgi:hypothetical protein
MTISAIVIARNDNYGGNLAERSTYCLNTAINTYDEVIYIDWNSENHSLLYDIKDNLQFKGNLKHIVISPKIASILTNNDPNAQKCCEVLARNIGIKRATGDWVLSSNIDIIHPSREDLEKTLNELDPNTFYTISRRHVTLDIIKEFHGGECDYKSWESLRNHLNETIGERIYTEKIVKGDDYSMINCCGDYQIAKRHIWETIKGFEEELIYCLYTDTNVQKKAAIHGFGLKAIYNPPLFHVDHGPGGGGFMKGINKVTNDPYRAVTYQEKTENTESWGFGDTEIEFEIF